MVKCSPVVGIGDSACFPPATCRPPARHPPARLRSPAGPSVLGPRSCTRCSADPPHTEGAFGSAFRGQFLISSGTPHHFFPGFLGTVASAPADHPAVGHDAHLTFRKARLQPLHDRNETLHVGRVARPQLTAHRVTFLVHRHPHHHLQPVRAVVFVSRREFAMISTPSNARLPMISIGCSGWAPGASE
jgi:hypothetical protein